MLVFYAAKSFYATNSYGPGCMCNEIWWHYSWAETRDGHGGNSTETLQQPIHALLHLTLLHNYFGMWVCSRKMIVYKNDHRMMIYVDVGR